jgi:hypothetical protein
VPLIMLGRLTSGAPLPVMVDPANPQKLIIDWSGSLQSAFAGPGTAPAGADQYADAALRDDQCRHERVGH